MLDNYSRDIIDNYLSHIDDIKSSETQELYDYLKSKIYKIYDFKIKQCMNTFPKNDFISPILYNKTKEYKNCVNLSWVVKHEYNINCNLYFYTKDFNDLDKTFYKNLIQKLIKCISFVSTFQNKNFSYKIHYVPLNDKKKFKKNIKSLTKHLINSGCSINREKDASIFVWRIEEFTKVIFHEFIHSFIDHGDGNHKLLKKYRNRYKLYSRDIDFFESYCEIWGRILNCFYISNLHPVNNPYDYFCILLSFEIFYAQQKSLQILELKQNNNILLDDHTNVTAYYLITSELFLNFQNFLKKINKPNIFNIEEFYEFLFLSKKINKKNIIINDNYLKMSCMQLKI